MIKAISRTQVDLRTSEVFSTLFQILRIKEATSSNRVPEFEDAFASYIGTKYAVSFPYCRSGMYFALKALDLQEKDEVILPAFTFWVDAAMVILAGLNPVFVDVQFNSATMDPALIEKAITSRTKVLFPTHLNGLPADMDPIMDIARRHNLRVLEDCARSCGAAYKGKKIGSYDIGTFSFGYGKSFYGFGGAMVTSDDTHLIQRLREFKKAFTPITAKELYIQVIKGNILRYLNLPCLYRFTLFPIIYQFQVKGNERYATRFRVKMPPYDHVPKNFMVDLNNVQAKLGFKQIERIDDTNRKRMENAKILSEELAGIPGLELPPSLEDREHVAVHYAIWAEKSKDLQRFLMKNGIDAQDETAVDTTQLNRFKSFVSGRFPQAEKLDGKLIFLPTHPNLKKKDMLRIAQTVKRFF